MYAFWIVVNYREAYNMFATNGILFNHESPRRGTDISNNYIISGDLNLDSFDYLWEVKLKSVTVYCFVGGAVAFNMVSALDSGSNGPS